MKHVLVTSHRAGKSRMESSRYMRTVCIPKCCTDKVSTTEFQEHSISPASGQGRLRAQKKSDSQSWKRSILKEIEHILLCYVYIFSSSICAGDPGLLPPQNEVVSSGLYVSAPPPLPSKCTVTSQTFFPGVRNLPSSYQVLHMANLIILTYGLYFNISPFDGKAFLCSYLIALPLSY